MTLPPRFIDSQPALVHLGACTGCGDPVARGVLREYHRLGWPMLDDDPWPYTTVTMRLWHSVCADLEVLL